MRYNFDYASKNRNAPFGVITQWVATFQDNLSLDPWLLRKEPIGCPEKLVRIYYSLRNNTEERSSQLRRSGDLKSRGIKKLGNFYLRVRVMTPLLCHGL